MTICEHLGLAEILKNSKQSTKFNEVTEEIIRRETNRNLPDEATIRRNEIWGLLGNQVVGFEKF
jgi:hypothetical protein